MSLKLFLIVVVGYGSAICLLGLVLFFGVLRTPTDQHHDVSRAASDVKLCFAWNHIRHHDLFALGSFCLGTVSSDVADL